MPIITKHPGYFAFLIASVLMFSGCDTVTITNTGDNDLYVRLHMPDSNASHVVLAPGHDSVSETSLENGSYEATILPSQEHLEKLNAMKNAIETALLMDLKSLTPEQAIALVKELDVIRDQMDHPDSYAPSCGGIINMQTDAIVRIAETETGWEMACASYESDEFSFE